MTVERTIAALAARAAARPRPVLIGVVLLALAGAALALRLQPTAATSTFVSSSSSQYRATQTFYKGFGEEPIEVLVKGNLQQLVLSEDIARLAGLEGCLSGNVPSGDLSTALAHEGGVNGPCGEIAKAHTVKVVFGPGTFVQEAANQIDAQIAEQQTQAQAQAKQAEHVFYQQALAKGYSSEHAHTLAHEAGRFTIARFKEGLVSLALEYGLNETPSISNANFVSDLVFDSSKPAGTPKQRFAYLFPSRETALISVRMRAGLSQQQKNSTITLIRRAVAMPQWHLTHGESYLITGEPVIVSDLTHSITDSILLLLVAALIVMAGTLSLIFRARPRLLPLLLGLLATALTFGALSLVGASLTMASIAVLPVLIGLAVDYAVQFQSRVAEQREGVGAGGPAATVARAAGAGGPTILTAAAASAAAMLVLLLSPVPMVRGFGLLLVVGIAIALLCTLLAGAAALSAAPSLARSPRAAGATAAAADAAARGGVLAASWRGARELLADNALTRLLSHVSLERAVRAPGRVLAVGLVLAALGWGLDTQTHVETDITKLVPQSLSSLRALSTVERSTGVGGEIAVLLSGRNLAKSSTIEWMTAYQSRMLARFGYSSTQGCGHARLCPAFSLPDLFGGTPGASAAAGASGTAGAASGGAAGKGGKAGSAGATKLTQSEVDALLAAIPPYFSQDVITPDRRLATLAFGIRLMSLEQQQQLVEQMRSALHPPAGVQAQLVGLPVLAAQSGSQVADPWRRLETLLAALAVVALVLLAAFRGDRRRALVPLAPIVLATGWSALIVFAIRVPLNPMSVTLNALVIAIATEFSVLLSERQRQERLAGYDTVEALRRAYRRTGAAIAASGVTAIAGFGVLILSDIRMLRDFGLVTLIDLAVSLIGVLIALPAAVVLSERRAQGLAWRPRRAERGDGLAPSGAGHGHGGA